jgi:hypothetical protein
VPRSRARFADYLEFGALGAAAGVAAGDAAGVCGVAIN